MTPLGTNKIVKVGIFIVGIVKRLSWMVILSKKSLASKEVTILSNRENFTWGYQTIGQFDLNVLNFKISQTRVSNFQNVSITRTPLGFVVKSYQNFQNTPLNF
jgi:hypothetical protein